MNIIRGLDCLEGLSLGRSLDRSVVESVDRSLGRSVASSLDRSVLAGRFVAKLINRRFDAAGGVVAKCKQINKMRLPDCALGPLWVGFNNKIGPRGTKSEAAVVIMNWGTQKESRNIGFIEALSAGSCYLGRFPIIDIGPQWEESKKENTQFILFSHPHKTPSESEKI